MQASLSDAGVVTVCINLAGLMDAPRKFALLERADAALLKTVQLHEHAEEETLRKLREALA